MDLHGDEVGIRRSQYCSGGMLMTFLMHQEEPYMAEHSGSSRKRVAHCNCGSLQATTVGEPITVATCFCEECQRRTGSAFGISTYWMQANVELSGSVTRYVREGQEGRKVTYY